MKLESIEWDGKRITKPGMYSKIPLDLYHSADICDGPSISSSGLRTIFNESPAHFFAEWRGNPNRVERKDSRAFKLGRATHHLVLGEKFFHKFYCLEPSEYVSDDDGEVKKWNNNATFCKKWSAAREKEGRTILKTKDGQAIIGMSKTLGVHPMVRAGALNGLIERSIFWKDKETGIWLKSRPDSIPRGDQDFVDLKTTGSVQWNDLMRTIADYGYHQQGALIRRGAVECLKMTAPTFTLVFVESDVPYSPRVVTLKDSDLELGDRQNRVAIDIFAQCLKTGDWLGPGGHSEDAEYIELSDYEQKRIADKIAIMTDRKIR